jgi:hypothetical protein
MVLEKPVTLLSSQLSLEGVIAVPGSTSAGAVLCHPHPQYGGTMDNNVVVVCARRLQRVGVATLRFNFRGVGASEGSYDNGRGEAEDARAAVRALADRTGFDHITLVGYSFGAYVALVVGRDDPAVGRIAAIAPPLSFLDIGFLKGCTKPLLFAVGDSDQYCSSEALRERIAALGLNAQFEEIEGADHFLFGDEELVAQALASFVA